MDGGPDAQCDFWFPLITLPVGFGQTRTATQLPVLSMITGNDRLVLALLLPTRRVEDLEELPRESPAVPRPRERNPVVPSRRPRGCYSLKYHDHQPIKPFALPLLL